MQAVINKLLLNKFIIWGMVPLLLFIFGSILTLIYIYNLENSFLVLVQSHSQQELISFKEGEILEGDQITGEFKALDNNLGVVSVRFDNLLRINDDILEFRIKEKGSEEWYYKAEYKVDQFQPHKLFPFGFPIITDSKDKIYYFEITSLQGKPGDAVAIDTLYPVFVSKYKFTKEELFGDPVNFVSFLSHKQQSLGKESLNTDYLTTETTLKDFITKKVITTFGNSDVVMMFFYYFNPFILYISWRLVLREYYQKFLLLSASILILILLDILFLGTLNDFVVIEVMIIWAFLTWFYRLESTVSYAYGLFILVFCPILLTIGKERIAEKVGAWAFMFLLVGVLQNLWELRSNKSKRINVSNYYQGLKEKLMKALPFKR